MFDYQINPDSETPIYRQLVEQIKNEIRSGVLKTGTQLPTVRQMAEKLNLSCGTVKHVYDCLQEMGDIEMTRRRGTFVKYVRKGEVSRKQQAMHAIDHTIRKLLELNFSPAEIQIFLNLKMREWGLRWSGMRMTVVTEYTEMAAALEKQLAEIGNVQVNVCPMRQLREYPHIIDEQSDVLLTAQSLSYLLPDSGKVIRVAFQPEAADVAALAACTARRVGVLCESAAFFALMKQYLPSGTEAIEAAGEKLPQEIDALVVPAGYVDTLSDDVRGEIAQFEKTHAVLSFAYRLDEGSMLYLGERISKIRDERQQWPGMLRL